MPVGKLRKSLGYSSKLKISAFKLKGLASFHFELRRIFGSILRRHRMPKSTSFYVLRTQASYGLRFAARLLWTAVSRRQWQTFHRTEVDGG